MLAWGSDADFLEATRLETRAERAERLRAQEFTSILIVMTTPLGDTLFARPAICAVRTRYPSAEITALGLPGNAAILQRYPELDDVVVCRLRRRLSGPVDLLKLGAVLRQRSFDLCIEMTPVGAVFSQLAAIPDRIGFGFQTLWWLLPDRAQGWRQRHAVHHYGDLVAPLGAHVTSTRLHLQLTESDLIAARVLLNEHHVAENEPIVTLHPGASSRLKRWSPRRFADLADRLAAHGVRVVVVGGKSDARVVARMLHHAVSRPIVVAGRLPVLHTAALQRMAALHVGNDSGPLHLATAVGTPTVGLFGPTNRRNFRPLGDHDLVLHHPKPCSPCTHFVGGSPVLARPVCRTCACLDELTVDEVEAACLRSLRARKHRHSLPVLADRDAIPIR